MNENVKNAAEIVAKDPMAVFLGIRLEEVREAYARLSVKVKPEYLNALNRAHGMIISSLIDQAVAVASNSYQFPSLVLELKINYLDAGTPGDIIIAEATPIDLKNRVSLWNINVSDSKGKKVACGQGLSYSKTQKKKTD